MRRQQQELVGLLALASQTVLWFIGVPVWYHLHHFGTNKLLQTEPALCRNPCLAYFVPVTLDLESVEKPATVTFHSDLQAMICSHVSFPCDPRGVALFC